MLIVNTHKRFVFRRSDLKTIQLWRFGKYPKVAFRRSGQTKVLTNRKKKVEGKRNHFEVHTDRSHSRVYILNFNSLGLSVSAPR